MARQHSSLQDTAVCRVHIRRCRARHGLVPTGASCGMADASKANLRRTGHLQLVETKASRLRVICSR